MTRDETVVIRSVGARGDGVASSADGEVYLPYTLPGERVRARISGERGAVIDILEPSPDRVEAPCRHFSTCGGCALQHWRREKYLAWKRGLVVDALARAGLRDVDVAEVVETPAASRRRATVAMKRVAGGVLIGFKGRASHAITAIDACGVLRPELLAAIGELGRLAAFMPAEWGSAAFALTLCDNGVDLDIAPMVKGAEFRGGLLARFGAALGAAGFIRASLHGALLLQHETPIVRFADVAVTPPPGGFLQASAEGEAALVDLVLREATDARRAVDLFSGCGSFTFPLARIAAVAAFDGDDAAIAALDAARRRSALKPVTATRRDLFQRPVSAEELKGADVVVFDPPRAGAAGQAAELARSRVTKIIGVSCNPQSFARDAAILSQGGYQLTRVTPVDQFVYSAHVELVGVFERRRNP